VFESIKSIRPYFHSLREIENNVSLDIKLPLNWKYEEILKPYRSVVVKIQDKNEKFTLMSLISSATQEGYDVVFACALEIFKVNKEKQKLFQSKVKELQELFKNESLDKLKGLNLLDNYGQENTTGIGDTEEGDREGLVGDRDEQEEND
jgi:hypothetical protein